MKLGICTRYTSHEATYAAIRIANWVAAYPHLEVSLFTPSKQTARIVPRWDKAAQATKGQRFTDWAKGCDTVMWTHCPTKAQAMWTRRQNIHTVIFSLWHELSPADQAAYREVACVISPSREAARFLSRNWQIKYSAAAVWDPGVPLTLKDQRLTPTDIHILLPLFDGGPYRTEGTALEIAGRAVQQFEHARLTVAYNSSRLASFAKRRLREFVRLFPTQVRLLTGVPFDLRPLLFRDHDLTIWPSHAESTCMVGLTSLCMGTPVLAFNIAPINEFLNNANGLAIPCKERKDEYGMPLADPNYPAFETGLMALLRQPSRLAVLQDNAHMGLVQRRAAFHDVLSQTIFPQRPIA